MQYYNNNFARIKLSTELMRSTDVVCKNLHREWPIVPRTTFAKSLDMFARIAGYSSYEKMVNSFDCPDEIAVQETTLTNIERKRLIVHRICFIGRLAYSEAVRLAEYFDPYLPYMVNVQVESLSRTVQEINCEGLVLSEIEKLYISERDEMLASLVPVALGESIENEIKKRNISHAICRLNEFEEYIGYHRAWASDNRIEICDLNSKFDFLIKEILSLTEMFESWKQHVDTHKGRFYFYRIALFIVRMEVAINQKYDAQLRYILKQGVPAMIVANP